MQQQEPRQQRQQQRKARYGCADLPTKGPRGRGWTGAQGQGSPARHFGVIYASSLGVFFLEVNLFSVLLFSHATRAVLLLAVALIACTCLILGRHRSPYHLPLGIGCMAAAVLGSLAGYCCYSQLSYFAYMYGRLRLYENVVPLERATAVSDAGRIVFADEAHVDTSMSAGYAAPDGVLYCVAPVRGLDNTTSVEFWAAGEGCCDPLGGFSCDAAGTPTAHGGVVIAGNHELNRRSDVEHYDSARAKAEANYGLISGPAPLFVRWVTEEELSAIPGRYFQRTCGFIFAVTVLYAFLSAAFVWAVCKTFHGDLGAFPGLQPDLRDNLT